MWELKEKGPEPRSFGVYLAIRVRRKNRSRQKRILKTEAALGSQTKTDPRRDSQ